jgi:hypothetical protein
LQQVVQILGEDEVGFGVDSEEVGQEDKGLAED